MKQIKKLEPDELKRIYRAHIQDDFPRNERRPFSAMEKMTKAGKYVSYGLYGEDGLQAYACYILLEDENYALLDYFAVIPVLRGHGIGSEFLRKLNEFVPVEKGTFVEAESPDSAKDAKEALNRQKRIDFYLSNGAVMTNSKCRLFHVDYNILYLSKDGGAPAPDHMCLAVEGMYREMYRPLYGRLCKPYLAVPVREGENRR
ncbi:MAG: N-acetyltransferase [Lachnospiraceae bacterium]|nr:N-acetyltransferase [Lachnospiraceae bacterium]